jgi:hypothetical protein
VRSRLSRSRKELFFSEGEQAAAQSLDAISQHLTRALADTSGLAAVGKSCCITSCRRYPVNGSLAAAAADGELSSLPWLSTRVSRASIPAGSGVIGAVHVSEASSCLMSPRCQSG